MEIVSKIFVWGLAIFSACIGIIAGGTIGWIIGGLISLITKLKCTFTAFNVAVGASLVATLICFYVSYEQIQPLNCEDGFDEVMICLGPSLIPFWGAVVGGFLGACVGVLIKIFMELKDK
ncbi:MAG: hypothetical protein F6K35_32285 [Okeania sp. SIO2H7]|nr:hypothetical protein [Okeania sp. SIO2H7]